MEKRPAGGAGGVALWLRRGDVSAQPVDDKISMWRGAGIGRHANILYICGKLFEKMENQDINKVVEEPVKRVVLDMEDIRKASPDLHPTGSCTHHWQSSSQH